MPVLDYHNHPKYNPKDILNGFDISVYRVNDQYLRVKDFFFEYMNYVLHKVFLTISIFL